jgi:hypothetical protein
VTKSRFSGLASVLKSKGAPPSREKKKVAKSQDKEHYAQTTVYLSRDIYGDLQKALTDEKREYSQLVEDLLRDWLKVYKRPDV